MPEQDKINRWVMKVDMLATSKQRRFFKILSGGKYVQRGTTRGQLAKLISAYTKENIAKARIEFKATRPATKYMKALGSALGFIFDGYTRREAQKYLDGVRLKNFPVYKAAKAKVKGLTYENKISF
jgi:hypothetical protein